MLELVRVKQINDDGTFTTRTVLPSNGCSFFAQRTGISGSHMSQVFHESKKQTGGNSMKNFTVSFERKDGEGRCYIQAESTEEE